MKNRLSIVFTQKTLCLLVGVWFFISTNAQIPGLTQFTINDGLPSNTIYEITQDSQGNLLFATDYGLSKYDGNSFKNFTIEDGLPDNEILQLFKDSKQRIWLIGFNEKIGFLFNNSIFNQENTPFLNQLKFNSLIVDVFEDSKKNIWFLDSNFSVFKLNTENQVSKYNVKTNAGFNEKSKFFLETKSNEVLIATSTSINNFNKIYTLNITKPNENWIELKNLNNISDVQIEKIKQSTSSLLKDLDKDIGKIYNYIIPKNNNSTGNLLFKTYSFDNNYWVTNLNKGAFIFNKNQQLENPIPILQNYQPTRAFQDREKNIWVGTMSNGVVLFPDNNTTSINFENTIDNDLYTVTILNNHIFMGNSSGKILVLNKKTLKHTNTISLNKNQISDRARVGKIHNNKIHLLSNSNYITIDDQLNVTKIVSKDDLKGNCETQKSFKALSFSGNSTLIANAGGIFKANTNTKKTNLVYSNRTTAVLQNKSDTIWFGSTNGLHFLYQNKVQKPDLKGDFNSTIITDLESYNNGILIATNSKGVGFLKNGKLSVINKRSGLLSNSIKTIFVAPNNVLWISTNYGLNSVKIDNDFKPICIDSYTISEGLNTNDVRNCFVTDGFAYVATSKGLNIIDLKSKKNLFEVPTVHINEIILDNNVISLDNNQEFSSNNNNIQFNFSGISFKSIGNISFKYRLIGLEDEWIGTKNNSIRYSTLPFGNYTFELKSITKNGIESTDIYQYSFKIKRPFYHTWIFRIFVILVVFGGLYSWYFKRINDLKKQKEIDEKISNLRFKALNAQMNPHFINNLLTMIIELISKGEKEKALKNLFSFSNLVNLVLQSTKSNLISLQKELSILDYFVELNSLKYQNDLVFKINLNDLNSDDLESVKIPPMILQPIIENCIRHGLESDHPNPTIQIDLAIEDDEFLICTITDNGNGITSTESKSKDGGISLHNIDERLMLMNDKKCSDSFITMNNLSDEFPNLAGIKVELRIPLIYL
ncbi:MAG: two-component regulator propeller domain-containing protein [Flavobacteriaceae bacterium]|nr:two-component regulator propeller domain-containing protein [Flavobacteriaceae bacterium]